MEFYPLIVDEIREEAVSAYTIYFKLNEELPFSFLPGQYLTLRLHIDEKEVRRPYSISSAALPRERLSITIKRIPGGLVSNYLGDRLQGGDVLNVSKPMGHFCVEVHPANQKHYILIGAGSGISPLIAIAQTVLACEPWSRISLWYGNRDTDQIIRAAELRGMKERYRERFTWIDVLSQPAKSWKGLRGRLDTERVYELILDLFMEDEYDKRYFLCGPEGMMEAAWAALDKHAVDPDHVYQEYYGTGLARKDSLLPGVTGGTAQPLLPSREIAVRLYGNVHNLEVSPGTSILDAALAAGLEAPYACGRGVCSACKARCIEGAVSCDETRGLSEEDVHEGYILTCRAFPMSEGVLVDYDG